MSAVSVMDMMETISSRENKKIKCYQKLSMSGRYRKEQGLFVIESRKLVEEALISGVGIEKVFVTRQFAEQYDAVLQKLFRVCHDIYGISDSVEQKLTQTKNAGGVFAVCKRPEQKRDAALPAGRYVFLCDLQDTGNVGTIIRTAEALGVDGVILSPNTCDIFSMKVLRAGMGSVFRTKFFCVSDPLASLRKWGKTFVTYAAVLDDDAENLVDVDFPQNSIIVVGNEGNGLCSGEIGACGRKVTIRMNGKAESLNAGMAAGILMWELTKEKRQRV